MPLPPDLTLQQLRVITLVAATPGLTGAAVAGALGVSAPTCSGLVRRLAAKGIVERRGDDADQRVRRIFLTPHGEELIAAMDTLTVRTLAHLFDYVPVEDLHAMAQSYRALLAALERAAASACPAVPEPGT